MDLSFAQWERGATAVPLPVDLAVLLVAAASRQGATATARRQAVIDRPLPVAGLLTPVDGAFDGRTAALLRGRHGL